MTPDLRLLAYSTLLAWVMLIVASMMRVRGWTPAGLQVSFGNRADVSEPSPAAARADRAARNMLENLLLFTALVLTAHAAGVADSRVELGARIFFWARVAYWPVYLVGIPYVRTAIWGVSLVGLGLIFSALM